MQNALLYDGTSARPFAVEVSAEGTLLVLQMDDGWSDRIPAKLLRETFDEAGRVRVCRSDLDGWSLLLEKPVDPAILALFPKPKSYGRWIDRFGLLPAVAVLGAITVTVVAAGYFAPDLIAPHIPPSWEQRLGSAMVGDFGSLRCRDADGQRALDALVERVSPGAMRGPDAIKAVALDVPVFNAAALPGGYIVVFRPAITETDTDALAGILAHEVAHVKRRHVTKALIRELGIGALIRLFAGETAGNAEQLVSLSYTRRDEAQADSDAIAMLKRANISPKPTAKLFEYLSEQGGEGSGYAAEFLQSHPLSSGRAQKFAEAVDSRRNYARALSADQSIALSNICEEQM